MSGGGGCKNILEGFPKGSTVSPRLKGQTVIDDL